MRRIIFLIAVCFVSLSSAYGASSGPLGLGIILGNPTALTGKYLLGSGRAFDFGVAFSFSDYILLYGDYLIPFKKGFGSRDKFVSQLIPYYGVGAIVVSTTKDRSNDDRVFGKKSGAFGLGVRIPFGIEWRPLDPEFGFFIELVPGISVAPETSSMFQGGVGLRYFF